MNEVKREESALESIEHELYDPKSKMNNGEVHRVRSKRSLDLPTSWEDSSPIIKASTESHFSFGSKMLLVAIILLISALSFSFWRFYSLNNVVSAANIDMTADIAPNVEGGEVVPLTLTLRNKNAASLESASLTLLYKQGNGSQDEQEKIQEKREIGTIKQGEFKKQDFNVTLYGSEGEARDLFLKLEYKVAGSNGVFNKVVSTQVVLRTPPISVHIDGDDTISIGQSTSYSFVVKNNSATTSLLSVLLLTLPNSFSIESTSPKPIARTSAWNIKKLTPGEEETVKISGSFEGKQGEVATVSAKIGSPGEIQSTIGIVYASSAFDTTLRSSPLTLAIDLNSEGAGSDAIRYADRATLSLTYTNTSLQSLEDVSLVLSLDGTAAVYQAINPTSGYYDSIEKTITWNKASLPDLAVLPPGASANLLVIIPIVQKGSNSPTLKATLVGKGVTNNSENVVTTLSKTWGVRGSTSFSASTQYKTSPFPNIGPIPPRPNQDTSYTARLTVTAENTLSSASVSFTLPAYVSWRDIVSDASAVTLDTKTRTVTWNVGRLEQGRTAVVDIGLKVRPSQSHVGQSPAITSGIIFDADEEVSRAHIRTTLSPLTTSIKGEQWPENPSLVVDK